MDMQHLADFDRLIVKKYPLWTLYLSEHQYYLGRCYLALNREGNLDPFSDCTDEEWAELRAIIKECLQPALLRLFSPDMLNYGNLRNVWPHCHWHIVPRYATPRTFEGIEFLDAHWGSKWSPYDKSFLVPDSCLISMRDVLRRELG
jgi:diadenosine tetraphosphate (Ap4A) HIT family hydrolase